jgi:hypothetical protein
MRHKNLDAVAGPVGDHPGMGEKCVERHFLAVVEAGVVLRLAAEVEPQNAAVHAGLVDEGDLGRRVAALGLHAEQVLARRIGAGTWRGRWLRRWRWRGLRGRWRRFGCLELVDIGAGEIGIEAARIVRQKRLEAGGRAEFLGAVKSLFLGARARLRSLGLCTRAVAEHCLLVCAASLHEFLEVVATLREIERGCAIPGHRIVERLLLNERGPELIVVLDVEIDSAQALTLRALNMALKRLLETAPREAQRRVRAVCEAADIGAEGQIGKLSARAGACIAYAHHLDIVRLRHAIDEPRGHRTFVVRLVALEELPLHVAVLGRGRLGLTGQDEGEQRGCEEEGSRHWRLHS